MKLSRKCEYALLTLIELSRVHKQTIPAAAIAEKNNIPRKFLDQILGQLRKEGFVESLRGSAGGYRLGRSPRDISLAEIIRLIDGPIAPIASVSTYFYQHTPSEQNSKLLSCFQDIRDYTARKLESITLDQFIG